MRLLIFEFVGLALRVWPDRVSTDRHHPAIAAATDASPIHTFDIAVLIGRVVVGV